MNGNPHHNVFNVVIKVVAFIITVLRHLISDPNKEVLKELLDEQIPNRTDKTLTRNDAIMQLEGLKGTRWRMTIRASRTSRLDLFSRQVAGYQTEHVFEKIITDGLHAQQTPTRADSGKDV